MLIRLELVFLFSNISSALKIFNNCPSKIVREIAMRTTKFLLLLCLLFSILFSVGCATVFSGTKEKINLNSAPKGANVQIKSKSGNYFKSTTTPATIKLPRRNDYILKFGLDGYQTEERQIFRKFNQTACFSYYFYIIPGLIDLATGAHWNLRPDDIYVNLQRNTAMTDLAISQQAIYTNGNTKGLKKEIAELKDLIKQQATLKNKIQIKGNSPPKIWLFSIGVSKFEKSDLNLDFATADAKNFYKYFRSDSGARLPKTQAILLTNRAATRAKVIQSLTRMVKQASEKDLVIIFLATHGLPDTDTGEINFLMYDTDANNLIATGLSHSDLEKIIERSRAKKVLFIIDACHSGSLGSGSLLTQRGVKISEVNRMVSKLSEASDGVAVLSASSSNEMSFEGEMWNGGVFTYHLLGGLKGRADKNQDQIITLRELYDYL